MISDEQIFKAYFEHDPEMYLLKTILDRIG